RETGLAESGAYSRDSSPFPRRRPFIIYLYRQPPSGQSRVYQVTQLRTDGVHCRVRRHRASSPQGSSSNGCCLCSSPWTGFYAPLFSHTHCWYVLLWTCVIQKVQYNNAYAV
ncbi:unnamed protein product, partial [Ascophyllum nodosum]